MSCNKSIYFGSEYTKTYKWKDNKLNFDPRISLNHGFANGFVDSDKHTNVAYSVHLGINLTYETKNKMTIKSLYSLNYNKTDYKNQVLYKSHTTSSIFSLQSINYFEKNQDFMVENNFTYITNSNIATRFKKTSISGMPV